MLRDYKNIIPKLISFDTNLNSIKGFFLSENFNFYPKETKQLFHYRILIDNNIIIPNKYDFRNGYYLKCGNFWYYERRITKYFSLKFKYDILNKVFYFNGLYSKLPFEIGRIFPVGRHLGDMINLDLFLKGYLLFQGSTFFYREKNICLIGPSHNGKTSFIKSVIDKNGSIIADDILILNLNENIIYPISYQFQNIGTRKIQKEISKVANNQNIIKEPMKINELFLIQNSTNKKYNSRNKNLFEYLNLCSLFFLNNNFIKSYIFEENLTDMIHNMIAKIKEKDGVGYKFINLKNFDFNSVIDEDINK